MPSAAIQHSAVLLLVGLHGAANTCSLASAVRDVIIAALTEFSVVYGV